MLTNLFLRPMKGEFELTAIKDRLDLMADVFVDPLGSGMYLVCGLPEAKEMYRDKRVEDPSRFPYVCLIDVTPEQVTVLQENGTAEQLRSARELVSWILQRFACHIEDDYKADITELYREVGVGAFYPKGL